MLSRSAGTAMLWWWDSYVEPYDLYDLFSSVAAFAADVDWVNENYDYATVIGRASCQGTSQLPILRC